MGSSNDDNDNNNKGCSPVCVSEGLVNTRPERNVLTSSKSIYDKYNLSYLILH
jgi:hypothetical protein